MLTQEGYSNKYAPNEWMLTQDGYSDKFTSINMIL